MATGVPYLRQQQAKLGPCFSAFHVLAELTSLENNITEFQQKLETAKLGTKEEKAKNIPAICEKKSPTQSSLRPGPQEILRLGKHPSHPRSLAQGSKAHLLLLWDTISKTITVPLCHVDTPPRPLSSSQHFFSLNARPP